MWKLGWNTCYSRHSFWPCFYGKYLRTDYPPPINMPSKEFSINFTRFGCTQIRLIIGLCITFYHRYVHYAYAINKMKTFETKDISWILLMWNQIKKTHYLEQHSEVCEFVYSTLNYKIEALYLFIFSILWGVFRY